MLKKKKLISVCLSMVLICAMTACATKPSEQSSTPQNSAKSSETQSTPQSKKDFTLKVGILYDPIFIDPVTATTNAELSFVDYMFEGLMRYEGYENAPTGAQCGQASSYSISEDGLKYTFVLRDDIFWSDGKPVVAENFVYSWQRLIDPTTDSTYTSLINMVENGQEIIAGDKKPTELGVKAVNEKTVEITLSQPCPYFLDICALPATFPVRKEIVEANGKLWYENPKTMICNGAYTLANWEHDDKLTLQKNEKYYDIKRIGPDRLDFTVVGDPIQALSLFSNKQFDVFYDIDTSMMKKPKQLVELPQIGLEMVVFNNQEYPFTNSDVRQAFSLAIDRNALGGEQDVINKSPLAALVPNGVTDYVTGDNFRAAKEGYFSVKAEDYEANCKEARRLLAKAGFKNGESFPTVRYLYSDIEFEQETADILSRNWEEVLGVKVEMVPLDRKIWRQEINASNYHISPYSWIADYNDPTTFLNLFESTNSSNDAKYNNPEYDAMLKEAIDAATAKERYAALHKAEDVLFGDSGLAPLFNLYAYHLVQDNISGYRFLPIQIFTLKYASLK